MSNATQRTKQANVALTIDDLLRSLDAGSIKAAETLSEPGSIGGSTTHPVKDVDDRLQKATEGSRSSENSEDVKEDHTTAAVDNTLAGTPGGQDSVQLDVGITSKATGEDPAAETDKVKGGKEDPGSSHPARTDNDELDGSKYSSDYAYFDALCKKASADGNDLLATLVVTADEHKKTASAPKPAAARAPAAPAKVATAVEQPVEDNVPMQDKQAVDALVVSSLADTVLAAEERAVKTAEYLGSYFAARRKQAEEGAPDEEGGEAPAPEAGGGGEMPAEAAGGDPMAGGAPAGGEGGGGQASPEDLQMLAQILQETGLTPEDLLQLIAGGAGGGEGGPEAGGLPPEAAGGGLPPEAAGAPAGAGAPPMDPMAGGKVANARRKPIWQAKTAADRAKYAKVKNHLMELISANNR